jgi:hypothetical protein
MHSCDKSHDCRGSDPCFVPSLRFNQVFDFPYIAVMASLFVDGCHGMRQALLEQRF